MTAPKIVADLVERFQDNEEAYRRDYGETETRREFLDPFFKALGWDIDNTAGNAEAYKDVVHEDSVKVGFSTKAPDYSFRVGGIRKFFLEAKKPAVRLKDDPDPIYQLRRYAWSAKLPLSIVSNFAEFAAYDCRVRPSQADKPSLARLMYFTCADYEKHWDEIASVFSKESLYKGSFDKYAAGKGKKGSAEVDEAFLEEIETWRDALARNIALRNSRLAPAELNFAVQQTIDRIIFLRICEDRSIETYGRLRQLQNGENTYARLKQIFQDADDRYNSGLFHFRAEKGRGDPDALTLGLKIDDKTLKDILRHLYYPESPYEFSVLPADILGQVYEQFLGKVIRLTAGGHAKVEDKPEVKKAGGVYYTPTYIVDYIVKQSVGQLLKGSTPDKAARLRIVDPACGSGSFLIGAYQHLLDWHCSWYGDNDPEKHLKGRKPKIYRGPRGTWRLTTAERKRILLNNIYGVDIDPQAVEVTKLSLLLKVLEDESAETIGRNREMFHERALPDLDANIRCGNSLVGTDFFEGRLPFEDSDFRINAFDWKSEFPQVFEDGGFNAVIGNPPYSYRNATEEALRPYYLAHYRCAEGNFDLYKFFVERSLSILRNGGVLGFIVSATFLIQPSFAKLRELLSSGSEIEELSPLGPGVFADATVDTTILIVKKQSPSRDHRVTIRSPSIPTDLAKAASYVVPQSRFATNEGSVFDYRLSEEGGKLVARLLHEFPPIESGYEFGVGINTGFIRDELVADRRLNAKYHPMVAGDGISRYGPVIQKGWIMYDADFVRSRKELGRSLPAEHLLSSRKILVVRTRNLALPQRVIATLDEHRHYNLNRLSNIVARPNYSLEGLLGILNSSLFNWLYSTRFFDYEIKPVYLRASPMANTNDPQLVKLVKAMLTYVAEASKAKTPHKRTLIERRIRDIDAKIDVRVFEIYRISTAERRLVVPPRAGSGEAERKNRESSLTSVEEIGLL